MAKTTSKQGRKPFEVKLSADEIADLGIELSRDIDDALAARSATDAEVMYWHTLYEQGRTRNPQNQPWADAADLTSHIGTEKVDALRARLVKTIMGVEPVFTVEGWGDAEKNAPFVEEFHQWQLEAEGFQNAFSRAIHLALIEPMGVLEVYEDTLKRKVRKTIQAKIQTAPDGTPLVDEKLKPILEMGPNGKYIEVSDESVASAETEIDSYEVVARGPRHRTIAYRDFLMLPGHAKEKSEVWAYGKRFFRRHDELKERVAAGMYDKDAVDNLPSNDEHASETTLAGDPVGVTAKATERAEIELWELLILKDLGDGLRWYVATLHQDTQTLLRFQYDDIGKPRYFPLVPFPRPNSVEGYSFIGHKLITTIEEHTAWRNMDADKGARDLQMPIKRLQNALWDPDEEPLGAKAVITVRDMNEVQMLDMGRDTTGDAEQRIGRCERAAERIAGITDVAAGVVSAEKRTLGEVTSTLEQSNVRMDEARANIQETLEDIAQVRHLMWKRALREMGEEGLDAPPSVQQALTLRGAIGKADAPADTHAPLNLFGLEGLRAPDISGQNPNLKFTAQMLEGSFRFKPKGSVDTADRAKLRQDFTFSMQAMAQLVQAIPALGAVMQTPAAVKATLEQWVRLFHVSDKQAFLGSDAMAALQAPKPGMDPNAAKMQAEKGHDDAMLEGKRMDNETKLAIATLQGKFETLQSALQLFLAERQRVGLPGGEMPGGMPPPGAPPMPPPPMAA